MLGIFGDLQSSFFYQREHRTNLQADMKGCFIEALFQEIKQKDSCLPKFNFPTKITFLGESSASCLIIIKKKGNLSGISYFDIYFGNLLKAYPPNCQGKDTLNASKLSWLHTREVECLTFHRQTRIYVHLQADTHTHTTTNSQQIDSDS